MTRRRLMLLAKSLGGDDVVQGSFEVTEETGEFKITGLGFTPRGVIVCENEFEAVKKRTCGWIKTDVFSAYMRYTTDTTSVPAVTNQTVGSGNSFIAFFEDGFTVMQANAAYPITPKTYNYIVW